MTLLINPGYAMKFNGISDSVLIPVNQKEVHGMAKSERKRLPTSMSSFTLETWIIPDSGGVVFEQENVMRLNVGSPSSPAPAAFEVRLRNLASGRDAIYTISTAKPVSKANGRIAYWDGVLFPSAPNPVMDTYVATDVDKNDLSAFSEGSRELLNVTVTFDRRFLSIHVNGDLAVSQDLEEEHELVPQQNQMFIGGRGGDFRGTIEAIHMSAGALASSRQQYAPVKSDNTIGLWRFEEPINPISLITTTPSISASTSANSTITIGATAAQALVDELSGQSGLTSIDFTASPYSGGSYSFQVHTATSSSTVTVPKVPYNILVNPTGYDQNTGKPTNKAPERMRLMSIDASAGTITVESIHLDFDANASTGRRGVLMAHDAGRFVIITGDCVIDSGKGNEFQPHGSGTQFSQRQSQVLIDESDFENHGIAFSLSMAIDNNEFNAYSAKTTNMGNPLLSGHSGRHTLNHVTSHPFMGTLPPVKTHDVEKKLDVSSDVIIASFSPQFADVKDVVTPNSVVSSFDSHGPIPIKSIRSVSRVTAFIENGMADIDDTQRELLAIGGANFDVEPFMLKSMSSNKEEGKDKFLVPSSEARVAILNIPQLVDYDYSPFIQVHYNAIDIEGDKFTTNSVSRLTTGISGGGTVLTLESIKSFGADETTIPATQIVIGSQVASTNAAHTATIDFSAKTLTFSSATESAFQTAATTGAIVRFTETSPKIMVSKTLPKVSTILTGSYSIMDLIRDSMRISPPKLYAPGGVIVFDAPDMFPFDDGELEGETPEGTVAEKKLNFDLCPENYLPLTSTDSPQTTPQAIALAQTELSTRSSTFHRVLMRTNQVNNGDVTETADIRVRNPTNGQRRRIGVKINNSSGYAASTTGAMTVDGVDATTVIAVDNTIFKANGKKLGVVTAVSSTSVTIGGGTTDAVVDNDELFITPQIVGRGTTNQSSCVHEIFDIIEHKSVGQEIRITVQPSERTRFMQLAKAEIRPDVANHFTVESLMSRGRVLSFADDSEGNAVMRAHGLISDIASASVSVKGSASPDSHIVKEIMPGAPVVTMTLGGAGQGAINAKETWDPSPLSRLAWNTRRDCQTRVDSTTSTTVVVSPLNNKATDLQSWGTYCFPQTGRIYFEVRGNPIPFNVLDRRRIAYASAEYTSKTGTTFTFASGTGHEGTGKFKLANGSEADSLSAWITATGIRAGSVLHVDDKFSEETMCSDGTTINDRLFQTLDTVQHDYQLGSQYASTRALVEIPLFEEFFFDQPDKGIFPGPDNSMKLHIDATHTAHSWAPNPVGRRAGSVGPKDPEIFGPFSYTIADKSHVSGTKCTRPYDSVNNRVYVEDANIFPIPTAAGSTSIVANLDGNVRYRKIFLASGEWATYDVRDTTDHYLQIIDGGDDHAFSENFLRDLKVGAHTFPACGYQDMNYVSIADNPGLISAGYENRRSFYYDRSNVMTQGGNVDYGLRQYVSAIEIKAGPTSNPHLPRTKSGRPRGVIVSVTGSPATSITLDDASLFPIKSHDSDYKFRVAYKNASGTVSRGFYDNRVDNVLTIVSPDSGFTPSVGDEIYVEDLYATASGTFPKVKETFLSRAWAHPYAAGGMRQGDTIWMNMHYTNPHAVEGLFCKSRGVFDESQVHATFNGGKGVFNADPRDSIPMENFLIGDTCIETAQNLVQHINQTIKSNYSALRIDVASAPTVAYLDPYQTSENFARVLLYDTAHDREFIAFQDLWMQVQSSAQAAEIGADSGLKTGTIDASNAASGSRLDVAAGFSSQNKNLNTTKPSDFIEASYAHYSHWNMPTGLTSASGGISQHHVGGVDDDANGYSTRTNNAVVNVTAANTDHQKIEDGSRERSTFFDTPDGTRVIPAFLAMKGIRSTALDLTNHEESRLQYLDHWTDMDFVRRLTVDLGEVALRDGVTNIESAAREVVRLINQAGAKNGRTNARRPTDQFLGEGDKFDLLSPGPKGDAFGSNIDPAATHQRADFATTASTHDPAPFWDVNRAFSSHDRGTHMGYVRAHLGRVVLDSQGNQGFSVVIHSTIPGAGGRNFCTWLDSSKAQSPYRPQYLIGHGGRFRNYWCQPDEMTGENMHPAPMPITRFGRPFAPITTLKEYLPPENADDPFLNNLNFGAETNDSSGQLSTANVEVVSGREVNSLLNESFETKSPASVLVDGLRIGTRARARINFGGMTQAGIPGWAPDAGKWGFSNDGTENFFKSRYGNSSNAADAMTVTTEGSSGGYIPKADMKKENIGTNPIYGLRFVDHRGGNHTIRLLYRQFGERFSNDNTYLPSTLDEEVIIHFDDRDVSQGGFTIGNHMVGTGEVSGQLSGGTRKKFKGNLWNSYPSALVGVHGVFTLTGNTITFTLTEPYGTAVPTVMESHPDLLGYLGFPKKEGMLQLSDDAGTSGDQGMTIYYTSRTTNDYNGPHKFFGILGGRAMSSEGLIMSPRINFTSVLTDEVIAAAVEYAINMPDASQENIEATSFDCTDMFAPDGFTLGEWGVSPTAIRIKTRSNNSTPLNKLFEASRSLDLGLQDGAASDAIVSDEHTGGLSNAEIDAGTRLDVGYIPKTVLHISTKYRGANANTATPVLVDSQNNIVDTTTWQRCLRGEVFTDVPGDHIIPRVDSPTIDIQNDTGTEVHLASGKSWALFGKLASNHPYSWGQPFIAWRSSTTYAVLASKPDSAVSEQHAIILSESPTFGSLGADDTLHKGTNYITDAVLTEGIRRAGSKGSSPFLYFRGGRDSPDHWVPLYFGGGFSGAVVDINDGTQNDYADFYTHPYASGPTGSAGFQNIGEAAGSYALIDANAMMAMFPGTPYLDQHKGQNNPPFFNQDAILPFDMAKGANSNYTGMTYTDGSNTVHANVPSPITLRFAHPHARYTATGDTTNQTTYMIFGPGQAFPHNKATFEPQGSDIVTAGNGYSAVPIRFDSSETFLPNQLANGHSAEHSGLNATSTQAAHLPMTTFFQQNKVSGFNYVMNWEPAKGLPSFRSSSTATYSQTFDLSFYLDGTAANTAGLPLHYHPFSYVFSDISGVQIGSGVHADKRKSSVIWHMDGGYHPGGHFLDNHVGINPPHPTAGRLATGSGARRNTSAFRVAGLLAKAYLEAYGGDDTAQEYDDNVVIVDATRCQNAEELGAVVSAAINTFPGKDPLKAIGGTFLPSMQTSHKQDRYGWVEFEIESYTAESGGTPGSLSMASAVTTVPPYGWLRVSNGSESGYAPYISFSGNVFTLGKSPITGGATNIFNPNTRSAITPDESYRAYVWTKAGTHRYNNDSTSPATRDHMCQVHFSGYVDAVDRTKPIGAVGWHGEPYSYLNSYGSTYTGSGLFAAGLGAWHPMLGFSPYGAAETCLAGASPVGGSEAGSALFSDYCVTGLFSRHLIAVSHESELPLIAKADRDGISCAGDWLHVVPGSGSLDAAGTVEWDTSKIHNRSRYVGPATAGPHVEAQMHASYNRPTSSSDYPSTGNAPSDAELHRTIESGDMQRATTCLYPTGDLFWDESVQKNNNFHEDYLTYANECIGVEGHDDYLDVTTTVTALSVTTPGSGYGDGTEATTGGSGTGLTVEIVTDGDGIISATIDNAGSGYKVGDVVTVATGDGGTLTIDLISETGLYGYYTKRQSARNFLPEHVVWKRMDGGGLTMPAVNARGLGMVPWVKRKDSGPTDYKTVGEKILGNVRFSFETTNAAMFPIIQAQELGHPQLAEKHPFEIRNALLIPNEEMQFKSVQVVDDTGQEHRIEGGSPFGTVILDFRHISDREIEGLAPALAGAGVNPNLKIRLPNPDEIPGNIIVRSGFDRIQGYQNETFGSGGLQHPAQNISNIREMFNNDYSGPRLWPTWENNGWEHLSQDASNVSETKHDTRLKFPASTNQGWQQHTDNNPLKTAYEPHDRSLFFHITRMGVSMTHRYDTDELSFSAYDEANNEIDVTTNPSASVWLDTNELSGGRYFLRVYDPTTDKGVIASYTNTGTNKFTGVVVSPDFKSFISGKTGLKVVPSYYMPAGSTRMFAARRLRDHSEYSGASPDMKSIDWYDVYSNLPADAGAVTEPSAPYSRMTKPKMTPMPIPRMGHHYVTPTMGLLPGHYAHPAYQRLYDLHHACVSSTSDPLNDSLVGNLEAVRTSSTETVTTTGFGKDPLVWFSTPTSTYGPSDIHGGAFTLMTETKIKYEGYGIAASVGAQAGDINAAGGHTLVLEAANTYTLSHHFPDPLEVGAYQIIIQPNVFKQQLQGFHQNHATANKAPSEAGTKVTELTGQQINTVIAIEKDIGTRGAYALILAEAMMADVRGCEIILNEVILDIDPDANSQFTNLPPLALYNPLGVQESSSPSFTRRSLPYRPGMFQSATPGRTLTVPWWGILHKDGADASAAQKFRHLEWHKPDNYYEFCRVSYGCIGAQLTLAGYPTTFLDIYEPHKRIRSLNPNCVVLANNGSNEITVDNADLFPVKPYYGENLEYTKHGVRYTATYTNRTGTLAHATLGESTKFSGVSADADFWSNLTNGTTILKLTRPYDNESSDAVFNNSETSIMTRNLPQFANGTRDTNSLHVPDAFLCMWHPNLGRPFTWYSDTADGGTRNFYTANGAADTPQDKKPYNHIPEHFETIHYQDFNYVASKGPFGLAMKWIVPPGGDDTPVDVADGTTHSAATIDADANLSHQGGTIGSNKYNFAGLWPGGSHGGGAISRLETYGHALIGWGSDTYGMDCETYQDSTGIATLSLPNDRNRCFGYRMSVRQVYNRPRWSPYVRGWLEVANSNALLGYYHGPLIQHDSKTNGWDYVGTDTGSQSDQDFDAMYVGILERITQVSSLLGQDQLGRQVRYSDGRRMTGTYGCAVRTLRNASTVTRLFPNDNTGRAVEDLAQAQRYYMVDWWGNTRGEDVRRFPVRGFGLRPSWDPEDAYADTNITHRPAANDLFGGDGTDRYSGVTNTTNNGEANMGTADWFNPASMLRVGDRGDGRGVRWPTVFNESLLMDVSENHDATGLVLSHSTAEPVFGQGLVRPSNEVLQTGEIERGISDRVDLNSEDGLLKPSAHVGEGLETVNADTRGAEPVSRDDVRLGLDVDTIAELNDGVSREYVVMSTEAASLHTDREVGQRTNVRGAYDVGNRTLKDLDMTALDWSAQPVTGVVKHSNAHAMWPLGGTYVMDWSKHAGNLNVKGWGKASASSSSNPYQDANHDPILENINYTDSIIQFLYRPVYGLDYKHSQMFRPYVALKGSSPQEDSNFYRATSGGKYGMFTSDVPSARTGTPSSPPYAPVYTVDPSSPTVADSQGPNIPGVDVTGYDKTDIRSPVARMVMSENTLEHFRADASRRSVDDEEGDYEVQPRFSQTLHPKGSDGDASYNTGDHSGE
jgi:hypothetical protein